MKKINHIIIVMILACSACKKDSKPEDNTVVPYTSTPYALNVPAGFPQPVLPEFNPMTVEGVQLGRMLYYDSILSTNGKRCVTCHQPVHSFSSSLYSSPAGDLISVPPHLNLAWNPEYNWAGSEKILDHVALGDFAPTIFNTNMPLLVQKLKSDSKYPEMFRRAFGINDVATLNDYSLQLHIAYAISQFMRTMISYNSRFDRFVRHEIMLTPQEMDGYMTFNTEKGDCFHCHGSILLTNNKFNNNGLDSVLTGQNEGLFLISGNENDRGKFSSPTLRNCELTAPYMHDGRFQTLEEVVEFYNSGVNLNSPNIDPIMTKPAKLYGLQLTSQDKANLVAFLKTLTDTVFMNNPDFSNPH